MTQIMLFNKIVLYKITWVKNTFFQSKYLNNIFCKRMQLIIDLTLYFKKQIKINKIYN